MAAAELVADLVGDEVDVERVTDGVGQAGDAARLDTVLAQGAQGGDAAATGTEYVPEVVVGVTDHVIDQGLVFVQHHRAIVVCERVGVRVVEQQLVVVADDDQAHGQVAFGHLVDAGNGGVHLREHLGVGSTVEVVVFTRAAQGQAVLPQFAGTQDFVGTGWRGMLRDLLGRTLQVGGVVQGVVFGVISMVAVRHARSGGVDVPAAFGAADHRGVKALGRPVQANVAHRIGHVLPQVVADAGEAGGQGRGQLVVGNDLKHVVLAVGSGQRQKVFTGIIGLLGRGGEVVAQGLGVHAVTGGGEGLVRYRNGGFLPGGGKDRRLGEQRKERTQHEAEEQ